MANKFFSKLRAKAINWLDDDRGQANQSSAVPYNSIANVMNCYRTGSYDNNFPNITRIAESFAEVEPFAVDDKGERLKVQPLLMDILANPNAEMSGTDFWETLAVMMLVHPIVYLLVWHEEDGKPVPGGPVTADSLTGLTFMEGVSASTVEGKTTYFYNGTTYTKDDVIALSLNVNPYSLLSGYSPSLAAKKWANVDDYVADYQIGYFRNGAVPAGQFVITARNEEEFNAIVDHMQATHRGASNANNVQYVHRPVSAIDGRPGLAQVEWVPFSQPTEKSTLQSIFDQANKKLDMDFAVPQEIKGYLQNSNYASAEVAEYVFARYTLYPKLKKIYSKLTHELNRVTGGLGFSLSFNYELPALTDTRKVQAETLQIMLGAGFTVESSVEALQLPSSFLKLVPASTGAENNIPATNTADAPSQTDTPEKSLKSKAVDLTEEQEAWRQNLNPELVKVLQSYKNGVIDDAIGLIKKNKDEPLNLANELNNKLQESGKKEKTSATIVAILAYLILQKGQEAADDFAQELGVEEILMELSQEGYDSLRDRVNELIEKFGADTIDNIVKQVDQMEGMTLEEIAVALELSKRAQDYRVERWAISEQHYAEELAVIIAATEAERATGRTGKKIWHVNPESPDICPLCLRMNGEEVGLHEKFSSGDDAPPRHPYCYCTLEIVWDEPRKSVKITCPDCGRYMMESTGGNMKNVICANSKCKKHFDIEVKDGQVKATERK